MGLLGYYVAFLMFISAYWTLNIDSISVSSGLQRPSAIHRHGEPPGAPSARHFAAKEVGWKDGRLFSEFLLKQRGDAEHRSKTYTEPLVRIRNVRQNPSTRAVFDATTARILPPEPETARVIGTGVRTAGLSALHRTARGRQSSRRAHRPSSLVERRRGSGFGAPRGRRQTRCKSRSSKQYARCGGHARTSPDFRAGRQTWIREPAGFARRPESWTIGSTRPFCRGLSTRSVASSRAWGCADLR